MAAETAEWRVCSMLWRVHSRRRVLRALAWTNKFVSRVETTVGVVVVADVTWSEFEVDLGTMSTVIKTVTAEAHNIEGYMARIYDEFLGIDEFWNSPAERSIEPIRQWFSGVQNHLSGVLEDMIARLQTAYDNYRSVELANIQNSKDLMAKPGPAGGGGPAQRDATPPGGAKPSGGAGGMPQRLLREVHETSQLRDTFEAPRP